MSRVDGIRLVNAFEAAKNEKTMEQAIAFWKKHKVLIKEDVLNQRAKELLIVAYDRDNQVIATSTAIKTKVKLLNNNFLYQYRCFVAPAHRVIGLDVHLTRSSLELLESTSKQERHPKPIGVFVVVENHNLTNNKINNAAVWRAYEFYFIGYTSRGYPIRVYYFEGARI